MARFTKLDVWHQARTLLRLVSDATRTMRAEGDLKSQMRRSAISVVSNISEGSERGNDREFRHFLAIANASAAEVEAQAIIAHDIRASITRPPGGLRNSAGMWDACSIG